MGGVKRNGGQGLTRQNPRRFKPRRGVARLDLPTPVADGEAHLVDGEAQRRDPVGIEVAQGARLQRLPQHRVGLPLEFIKAGG